MTFSELGLHPNLLKAVEAQGFTEPTPIQSQAIPLALTGVDLLGAAQTGSGKTAAFALPMLQHLMKSEAKGARALIMVPTRELAAQVEETFRKCGVHTHLKTVVVIGGAGYQGQRQAISQGAQIVVATPGRLLDHVRQGALKLDRIEVVVLDEADRMLDMGFMPDIRAILSKLPKQRQTMMFSATLGPEIERVAAFALKDPQRVEISRPATVAEGINQIVYPINSMQKSEFLMALLETTQIHSGVIFTRTKMGADRVSQRLKAKNYNVGVLHADRTQGQRTQAMERFREGKTQLLVATDIAARGIDVRHVSHVINYDVPQHPEDYVHRVGRTARAYGVGDAITLMCPEEQPYLAAIERFIGTVFSRAVLPNFQYKSAPIITRPKPRSFRDMNWSSFNRRFRR
jgi:ATP-dependent RNA helicase RhlE